MTKGVYHALKPVHLRWQTERRQAGNRCVDFASERASGWKNKLRAASRGLLGASETSCSRARSRSVAHRNRTGVSLGALWKGLIGAGSSIVFFFVNSPAKVDS